MGLFDLFQRHKTFGHGGVYPVEHKELTASLGIRRMPFPPLLAVPLSQHKGAPAASLVRAGQEVVRGEPIAKAQGHAWAGARKKTKKVSSMSRAP